jgi:hypothetical protein
MYNRFFALLILFLSSGCAGQNNTADLPLSGNEKGGKILHAVGGEASNQASAFAMLTAHCAKFGKKGFITQMDYDSGTLIFECIKQKPKNS